MLDRMTPTGSTNLVRAFRAFASASRQRGLAVVISDFLDPAGFEDGLRVLATSGHDVCVVHIVSAADGELADRGETRCVDAETGDVRDVDITAGLARAYREAWNEHAVRLQAFCRRYGLTYVRAAVETPVEEVMLETFRQAGFVA
jgi:hypothetical protein